MSENKLGCFGLLLILLIGFIICSFLMANGYHPQWSWTHGDFIWVNDQGKVAP